jgi:hypothetical protein
MMSKEYSTVTADDGVNYREIAETMTLLGFKMNHSSARNNVIRIMEKFVKAIIDDKLIDDQEKITAIARSSSFQSALSIMLQTIEMGRRDKRKSHR